MTWTATSAARKTRSPRVTRDGRERRGFTLLELLVTVSIMLILLAITATAVRVTNDTDRVRSAGRQVQSYLMGARDRAIYAKAPRGVRFLRGGTGTAGDPNDRANRLVTSMVYVEPTDPWSGQVAIIPFDTSMAWNSTSNPLRRVRLRDTTTVPNWQQLQTRGLLTPGLRIQIPASNRGTWYAIQDIQISGGNQDIIISTEYRNPNASGQVLERGLIELPASVIPNEEVIQLPRGVAIDLDRCGSDWVAALTAMPKRAPNKLPAAWMDANGNFTPRMDLMFSPRGTIFGPAASQGIIHFFITDAQNLSGVPTTVNLTSQANPSVTYAQLWDAAYGANIAGGTTADPPIPDKILTTIFTRTGNVSCSPVNTVDTDANGFADDPFFFAERGEVAGR